MPHEDGPLYYPVVLILSLGSSCILEFSKKGTVGDTLRVSVPPRSIVKFSGTLYTDFLHSIPFCRTDNLDGLIWGLSSADAVRSERYSVTFRYMYKS